MRTLKHCNHNDLTRRRDTGQYSQFLRCLLVTRRECGRESLPRNLFSCVVGCHSSGANSTSAAAALRWQCTSSILATQCNSKSLLALAHYCLLFSLYNSWVFKSTSFPCFLFVGLLLQMLCRREKRIKCVGNARRGCYLQIN